MTSCFVCATLNLGHKKSTGTEPLGRVTGLVNAYSVDAIMSKHHRNHTFFLKIWAKVNIFMSIKLQ